MIRPGSANHRVLGLLIAAWLAELRDPSRDAWVSAETLDAEVGWAARSRVSDLRHLHAVGIQGRVRRRDSGYIAADYRLESLPADFGPLFPELSERHIEALSGSDLSMPSCPPKALPPVATPDRSPCADGGQGRLSLEVAL